MNNSKGFTLLEMMVAAGLLAIALAGAMSFFIYQSQSGADSGKLKAARENISLALTLLQRDIMLAGYRRLRRQQPLPTPGHSPWC